MKRLSKGFVHLYTGTGKGKTTAAVGLALRAIGAGLRVCLIQFLKGSTAYNESKPLKKMAKQCTIVRFSQVHPLFCAKKKATIGALQRKLAKDFQRVKEIVGSGNYDVVVLDEVINTVDQRFLPETALLELIATKPQHLELVLTGRGASSRLKKKADYVTVMRLVKHPYYKGTKARPGIEY
jgi:cob(I)alamin adenosyltransferase